MSKEIYDDIIDNNRFMSIATSDGNSNWIAPVYYFYKFPYLYFASCKKSRHIEMITNNPKVSIAIFDSQQIGGDANGIQMSGTVELIPISNWNNIIQGSYQKMGIELTSQQIDNKIEEYKQNDRAVFKVIIDESYIQDREFFKKHRTDKRIRVPI